MLDITYSPLHSCSGPVINSEAFAIVLFCRSTPGEKYCCNFHLDDKTLYSETLC